MPELPPPPESLPASDGVPASFVLPHALTIAKKAQAARERVTSLELEGRERPAQPSTCNALHVR